MLAELVSLKADTQFIPPLKDVGFLAQFLAKCSNNGVSALGFVHKRIWGNPYMWKRDTRVIREPHWED